MSQQPKSAMPCPVCGAPVTLGLAQGRTSKKPFISLTCPVAGNHFRAFIGDPGYIAALAGRSPSRQR